jgi:transposase
MAYGIKLNDTEIQQRMVELRNLRRLHTKDRQQVSELKSDNKILRALVAELQQQNHTQAIQIAELQTMVFGKKKQPPTGHYEGVVDIPVTTPRTKASFRRPLPPASAITDTVPIPLPDTCRCGGIFTDVTIHDRFEEDIPLPELTPDYQPHLITKYVIKKGVCRACGKATAAKDLGGQTVTLGPNVRLLVTHLVTVSGMSYAQVASLLMALYGLQVSDGEIAAILQKQHRTWLPAYQELKADIRAAPIKHYDESPWAIQDQGNMGHVWVMSAHSSPKTLFYCATSRGAPHVQRLHGKPNVTNLDNVYVTDDYQAYRNLPGYQQLCWVHLYRSIRDLCYNQNLPREQLASVRQWYEAFAAIYQDLRLYLSEPYDDVVRQTQAEELWQRIQTLAIQPKPLEGEPDKLTRLKAQLLRAGVDRLLVCLLKDTPCDNNRAERDLRQLVLKRKRSFGSKTKQGAQALSTVLSICTTAWHSSPTGYFQSLAQLG